MEEPETKDVVNIIPAPPDTYCICHIDKDYWIERVWAFQSISTGMVKASNYIEWETWVTVISGNFNEGYIIDENEIVFVGYRNECEKELKKLKDILKEKKE